MKRALIGAAACACVGFFTSYQAQAGVINVPVSVQGMFSSFGQNNGAMGAGPGNFLTGQSVTQNGSYSSHSYFLFDLSALSSNVSSATLVITVPYSSYISSDPSETFQLYDVSSTSFAALQNQNTTWNFGVYDDLASGTKYGSRVFTAADNHTTITIDLNADAIAAINASKGSLFAIGGALTTLGSATEQLFGFTNYATNTTLQLTSAPVPEPATAMLLAAAPLLLRRRRASRNA